MVRGDLVVAKRRGHPFITKQSILQWLGLAAEVALAPPTLRNLRKAGRADR